MRNYKREISIYDTEGVFVIMVEGRNQGPMILKTEGEFSSRDAAMKRMQEMKGWHRVAMCRVIPVSGNELLALDMMRMQPDDDEEILF